MTQSEMLCEGIADRFSGIASVILPYDGEEAAVCVFIVVLPAVDARKSLPVIFHDGFGIFTAVNDAQKNCLSGSSRSKNRSTLMDWGESMTATC